VKKERNEEIRKGWGPQPSFAWGEHAPDSGSGHILRTKYMTNRHKLMRSEEVAK
jgi:hypothetical protein